MRKTRAAYHYAVRRLKKDQDDAVCERFASALLASGGSRDFWTEVKRIRSNKCNVSCTVDGQSTANDIANFFAKKYNDLYSCVPFDVLAMEDVRRDITNDISNAGASANFIITARDVAAAVSSLSAGKGDGNKGLCSDYLLNACDDLFVHLAMLLTSSLCHGYAPDDMLLSCIIPIPKGKSCNISDSANYRGIALSSIVGKILDKIIITHLVNCCHRLNFSLVLKLVVLPICVQWCLKRRSHIILRTVVVFIAPCWMLRKRLIVLNTVNYFVFSWLGGFRLL